MSNAGRWVEVSIYRTEDGRHVTEEIERTPVIGEPEHHFVEVYDSLDAIDRRVGGNTRLFRDALRKAREATR